MRGLKATIALVVVLGGLFAYIYFVTWKTPAEDTSSKLEKVFAGLQSDKIDEIRVNSESGDHTVLKKDKDGWKIVEPMAATAQESEATGIARKLAKPIAAPADSAAAEGLIGKVQSAQMKSIVTDNVAPADLKKYGLDKPAASITLSLGSAKASLLLGGKSGDGSLYAKDASKPVVMTVDPTLVDDFKKGPDDYRRKDLFAFRAYDATHIELTRGGQTVAFDKVKGAKPEDEDKWRVTKAAGAKPVDADKDKMGVFLAKLESLRAMSFADPKTKTGLDSPALTVYAKFDEGKKDERVTFAKTGSDVY